MTAVGLPSKAISLRTRNFIRSTTAMERPSSLATKTTPGNPASPRRLQAATGASARKALRVMTAGISSRGRGPLDHLGAEHREELAQPFHVRSPGRAGNDVAIGDRLAPLQRHVFAARRRQLGAHRRIAVHLAALDHAG